MKKFAVFSLVLTLFTLTAFSAEQPRRPDVVGNSYGCPPSEGCAANSLLTAMDNLRAAGIFMASPHVAGTVALLWSAFPALRGNVDATEALLQ